jgi:copper(I)-binding protein
MSKSSAFLSFSVFSFLAWMAAMPSIALADSGATLDFESAWIRAVPPASPVMAGYVTVINRGNGESILDAVESAAFDAVEIHEMRDVDGVMRMRPLPDIRIEPSRQVALAPGGNHLMLFRPKRDLVPGEMIELTFVFRDGSRRAVNFEVRTTAAP